MENRTTPPRRHAQLPPFENTMGRTQSILGWCYLPLHYFILPLLLGLYASFDTSVGETGINIIYYTIGMLFVLAVYLPFLRRAFDTLLDNLRRSVLVLLSAVLIDYGLSVIMALALMLIEDNLINPNNEAVLEMAESSGGVITGLAVFLAPVVEEVLFRGVVFGTLRTRSRTAAYIISMLLFAFYHVWQYGAAYSPVYLLYAVQYLPAAYALAWAYDRSGSIWVPVFFHMASNSFSLAVLRMM